MITENLSTLKIHKLTQEQYDRELEAGRIDPSALYLTPDNNDTNIYVQNEEPANVEDGTLWVDMDAVGISGGDGSVSGGSSVLIDNTLTMSGYAADAKATGDRIDTLVEAVNNLVNHEAVEQAIPEITVDAFGLITASATQEAGLVTGGTTTATHQLPVQAAQTVTPGTTNTVIPAGKYLTGAQSIKGDANLIPGNIRKGISLFGLLGTYEGSDASGGSGTSLPTLTTPGSASDLVVGKQLIDGDGNVVNGELAERFTGYEQTYLANVNGDSETLCVFGKVTEDVVIRKNAGFQQYVTLTKFGDATAADVAKGKTFTSKAGYKVTGTYEGGGDGAGVGNFFATEATLASDYSTKTGKVLCNIPYIGEHINDAGLFVALIRKSTDELTLTVPVVMACNSAYLNSSYSMAMQRTQYGMSVVYKPAEADGYQLNNPANTDMPRVYADASGNVYILPYSSYSFAAGTYSVIYGIL